MMYQDVAVAQCGEDALGGLALTECRVGGRDEGGILEVGTVDAVDLPQARQIEQSGDLNDVARIDIEFAKQQFEHVLGHVVGDLEADR